MLVKAGLFGLLLVILFSFASILVVGQTRATDFTLVDIEGNTFTLSNCSAKVILIDFFATWCGPCNDEIPVLKSLYDEYSRDQLEIISISSESESILQDFAQQQNMEWIVACDTAGVFSDYGVTYIPRTFLVDAEGYTRYDHTGWSGAGDESELRSKISSMLSGTGDSDSDTQPSGIPFELITIIGGTIIVFLVIGLVVARQMLKRPKPSQKSSKDTQTSI